NHVVNHTTSEQSTPTQTPPSSNYFDILQDEFDEEDYEDDDDDVTVVISNLSKNKTYCDNATVDTAELTEHDSSIEDEFSTIQVTKEHQTVPTFHRHYALLDSGATAHFLVEGAPVINKQLAKSPLKIKLPDGSYIQSTHTCNLNIPWLPKAVTQAHIVPNLAHSSLVSARKFCDAGCQVIFNVDECKVIYKDKTVLTGFRDVRTGLWKVPIDPSSEPNKVLPHLDLYTPKHSPEQLQHLAANVYTLPFKQQQLKYMHQSFFNPPIHTLIKAINNGQLENVPFMKADLVRKYLAPSPATSKGRMKRPRTGIRSTRKRQTDGSTTTPKEAVSPSEGEGNGTVNPGRVVSPTDDCNSFPFSTKPIESNESELVSPSTPHTIPVETSDESACHVFCYAALADKHTGTLYTDATGALPAVTLEGHQYYFVAYAYDINYIFAIPIRNVKDESILEAFDNVFQELKEKGYKPSFNVTDNQATTPIKEYLMAFTIVGSINRTSIDYTQFASYIEN
ncbi:hypothetical protein ACHAXN_001014, partial [Cyclotella atomus]